MVSTNSSIDSFVNHSMIYIRENEFDGIDIDWQFPAFCEDKVKCSPVSDAARFKVLLEKFRAAIESENVTSSVGLPVPKALDRKGVLRVMKPFVPN